MPSVSSTVIFAAGKEIRFWNQPGSEDRFQRKKQTLPCSELTPAGFAEQTGGWIRRKLVMATIWICRTNTQHQRYKQQAGLTPQIGSSSHLQPACQGAIDPDLAVSGSPTPGRIPVKLALPHQRVASRGPVRVSVSQAAAVIDTRPRQRSEASDT